MAVRVLMSHAKVLNDNSAVEVSVYILLLAKNEKIYIHTPFVKRTNQNYLSMCQCVCRSL